MNARILQAQCNRLCDLCGIAKSNRPKKVWYKQTPGFVIVDKAEGCMGYYHMDSVGDGEIWVNRKKHKGNIGWIWHTLGHELVHHITMVVGIKLQSKDDEDTLADMVGRILMEVMAE